MPDCLRSSLRKHLDLTSQRFQIGKPEKATPRSTIFAVWRTFSAAIRRICSEVVGMAKKQEPEEKARWEIRKGRKVWLASPLKNCGYPESTLKSLRSKGFKLYKDGKVVE